MTLPKLEKDYISRFPVVVGTTPSLLSYDIRSKEEKWEIIKRDLPELKIIFKHFKIEHEDIRLNK